MFFKEAVDVRFRSLSPVSVHEEIVQEQKCNEFNERKVKMPTLPDLNFTREQEHAQVFSLQVIHFTNTTAISTAT